MKKNLLGSRASKTLVTILSIALLCLVNKTIAQKPPCPQETKLLPQMWVSIDSGKNRFDQFTELYQKTWGFNKPGEIAITYSTKNGFSPMNDQFKSLGLTTDDSVRVYIAACGENEHLNIPGKIIAPTNAGNTKKYKLILIFVPVKDKLEKGYYVIDTTTQTGFTTLKDSIAADTLAKNYYFNTALNVTDSLNATDFHNHLKWDIHQPLSNTRYISYAYQNWKSYFGNDSGDEFHYQVSERQNKYDIDSVSAVFVAYDSYGDGQKEKNYTIPERVKRTHLIFQFSVKGRVFSIDSTDDFKCRKEHTDSIRRYDSVFYSIIQQAIDSRTKLIEQKTANLDNKVFDEKKQIQLRNEIKEIKGEINWIMQKKESFKSMLFPYWGSGGPSGGGGDNGQSHP